MRLDVDHQTPRTILGPQLICSASDALLLLGGGLESHSRELLRLAHLDQEGRVIRTVEREGGREALAFSIGDILRDACRTNTRRLVIAHNHPSGDPTPSPADRIVTRRLAELLRAADMELVDHLVVARGGISSFRGMGLL